MIQFLNHVFDDIDTPDNVEDNTIDDVEVESDKQCSEGSRNKQTKVNNRKKSRTGSDFFRFLALTMSRRQLEQALQARKLVLFLRLLPAPELCPRQSALAPCPRTT